MREARMRIVREDQKVEADIRKITEQLGLDVEKMMETVFGKQPVPEPNT